MVGTNEKDSICGTVIQTHRLVPTYKHKRHKGAVKYKRVREEAKGICPIVYDVAQTNLYVRRDAEEIYAAAACSVQGGCTGEVYCIARSNQCQSTASLAAALS